MLSRHSLPPLLPPCPLTGPAATARRLADRLTRLSRPLRVLDAVRWPDETERAFHAAGGTGLPAVDSATYGRPLPFCPPDTSRELAALDREVRAELGTADPAARLLRKVIHETELSVRLIAARGTPAFATLSRELYGSTLGTNWLPELTGLLDSLLETLPADEPVTHTFTATEAAAELAARFASYFGTGSRIAVTVCAAITADAAAGSGYLKLRAGARFSPTDVRLLEVHEGWAHLATTLNGQRQPVLPVLARCTPSGTRTQEGLAVFLELVTGATSRARVAKLLNRTRAVAMAEAGADFRDVHRFFVESTGCRTEAYRRAARVFRGSLPTGGPFTKDLSYGEGLVRVLRFMRQELAGGGWGRVPLLMCGKSAVEDAGLLAELGRRGWLAPPRWVPPPLRDRAGLLARLEELAGVGYNPV